MKKYIFAIIILMFGFNAYALTMGDYLKQVAPSKTTQYVNDDTLNSMIDSYTYSISFGSDQAFVDTMKIDISNGSNASFYKGAVIFVNSNSSGIISVNNNFYSSDDDEINMVDIPSNPMSIAQWPVSTDMAARWAAYVAGGDNGGGDNGGGMFSSLIFDQDTVNQSGVVVVALLALFAIVKLLMNVFKKV